MSVPSILAEILAARRRRLAAGELAPRGAAKIPSDGARFLAALREDGPRVIAEIKHRSPSAGTMLSGGRYSQPPGAPDGLDELSSAIRAVARAYRRAGAAAISVVTEPDFFGGDLAWLPEVKRVSGLPVLMKDFVVDEVQLDLALSLGADAILLIVAALEDVSLGRLHRAGRERVFRLAFRHTPLDVVLYLGGQLRAGLVLLSVRQFPLDGLRDIADPAS